MTSSEVNSITGKKSVIFKEKKKTKEQAGKHLIYPPQRACRDKVNSSTYPAFELICCCSFFIKKKKDFGQGMMNA